MDLRGQLADLEKKARLLEPSPGQRQKVRDAVVQYAEQFLDRIEQAPGYVAERTRIPGFDLSDLDGEPGDIEEILQSFREHLDLPGINPASGGHLGYIPGGGVYYSALGDYLADVTNRYAGVHFANPGAVEMEDALVRWIGQVVGYPDTLAGNLASGGSIANLTAIVTARDAHGLRAKDFAKAVIYMTDQVHHCVAKAIRIAGLEDAVIRYVPVDASFRMDADALDQQITTDKNGGFFPWLIVASAGTTDTGAVDPLKIIGEMARSYGMWFHIDGAYGALFNLCDEIKPVLAGMEDSDSIVVDPHKTLFLPYGTGAVLVRQREHLFNSHRYTANYMQDALAGNVLSPADVSPELTKHFRGLRMWLPLRLHGIEPFRAALNEKILLARYFWEEVQKIPGIEAGPFPDLSVVTFRYVPASGDANEANARIIKKLHADGRVFLSSTNLNGVFTIRLAAVCFRSHLKDVDAALEMVRTAVRGLGTGD